MRLLFVILGLLAASLAPARAAGPDSPRRAPGFALPDQKMKYHDLADYRGKVVLLEIMQTRCPNCQTLAKTLARIGARYAGKVQVLTVVTPPDNAKTVAEFTARHGLASPVLFDCGQMVGSYLLPDPAHPAIHVPHLFLIDSEGLIRREFDHTSVAVFEGRGLDAEIERLLAGKKR